MAKRVSLAMLGVLLVVGLMGCAPKAEEQVTIRFFHRWPQEPRFSYFNGIVEEFQKQNPNIKIEMDSVINDSYKEKIRVLISSDDVPDVFVSWSDSFAYNLVKSGKIKPLNDLLAKDKEWAGQFIQSQIKPFTFDGKVYGMPLTIDGKVLVYNKAAFEKAGIAREPATFDELLADLGKLKAAGYETPILEGLADAWTISHYLGTMFQRYLPAEVLAKDYAEATGEYTDPGYKVVLERFQKLVDFMGPNATSITHQDARNLFIAGKLPLIYLQIGEFHYIQNGSTMEYGYFNFPAFSDGKGDPGQLTGAPEGFMMSNTSKHPEAAEKFFKFLYSKVNAYQFVKDAGSPTAIEGSIDASNSFETLIGAVELIKKASASCPWFDNAVNIKIADEFMRGAQSVATKDKTVDQVMASVRSAADTVRKEAKK